MNLQGKKVIFLGDSITEGHSVKCAENVFHQRIKSEYGLAEAYNCGVSGTRIAKRIVPRETAHKMELYFALRATCMPKGADLIVIFGGTNDYGHGDAKLGDVCDSTVYTFAGAYNVLLDTLAEEYPGVPVVAMTPLKRANMEVPGTDGKPLSAYVDMIKSVCARRNVPVIDLFAMDDMDPYNKEQVVDGLHPGDYGHEILAKMVMKGLENI